MDGSEVELRARDEVVRTVRGACAAPGQHLGRARVVRQPRDLAAVERGDVVVIGPASAAVAVVFDVVGAVVAERGGVLSNLGTLSREAGVPCIVNAADAMSAIRDGDLLFVDADAGVVFVLAEVVAIPV